MREFAQDPQVTIPDLGQWKGRAKIAILLLKDQSRRDHDLSMQGCKRSKGETGEGFSLPKTDGLDADIKITQYKRGYGRALPQP